VIESEAPSHWRDLQDAVARILNESGLDAETEQSVDLARGSVVVDVLARDPVPTPPTVYICECKYWRRPVSQNVVHSFRTVVTDMGAHRGFLISVEGFQKGAINAAAHSNVDLITWQQFQQLFAERWFQEFMAPALVQEGDALYEYTEPVNSRILRKASSLTPDKQERFRQLRRQYEIPAFVLFNLWFSPFASPDVPRLPLRERFAEAAAKAENPHAILDVFPRNILDATELRPLMEAVSKFYSNAATEFDRVFGGRA